MEDGVKGGTWKSKKRWMGGALGWSGRSYGLGGILIFVFLRAYLSILEEAEGVYIYRLEEECAGRRASLGWGSVTGLGRGQKDSVKIYR